MKLSSWQSKLDRLTAASPPIPLRSRMVLANVRSTSPPLLTLGSLPAAYQLHALVILAVPLVPTLRLVNPSTSLAQTDPRSECWGSGRNRRWEGMLILSQGRTCSRWGRPRGCSEPLGHLLFKRSPQGVCVDQSAYLPHNPTAISTLLATRDASDPPAITSQQVATSATHSQAKDKQKDTKQSFL